MTTKAQNYNVDIADVEYINHGGAPLLAKLLIFRPVESGKSICRH